MNFCAASLFPYKNYANLKAREKEKRNQKIFYHFITMTFTI
jgi:hypothetical protein